MPPSEPLADPATGEINVDRILMEVVPLAKLIGLFVLVAVVPILIVLFGSVSPLLTAAFALFAQFVLAVGAAVVLLYVVTRALTLADG